MKFLLFKRQTRSDAGRTLFLAENANKGLGYLRNLIISWSIGFSNLSDFYFFVFGISSSVSSILGGALSATFIPYVQRRGSLHKRQLLGMVIITFSLLYLFTSIFASFVMIWLSPNRSLQSLALQTSGAWIISGVIISFLLLQLIQIADEYFKSRKNFIFGTLSYLIVSSCVVVTLYSYLAKHLWLIGWASVLPAGLICLITYGGFGLTRVQDKPIITPYLQQTWPLMLSGSMGMINIFVDRWFATGFPEGRLSILQTALLLVLQMGGVLINPIINSAYPFISSLYNSNNHEKALATTAEVEKKILCWLAIFTMGYLLIGEHIIKIFFHHGQVSLTNVFDIYRIGIIYLPVLCYSSLVSLYLRIMYCNQVIRLPAVCSSVVIIINILLNWIFSSWLGWQGLALAAAVSAGLYYLFLAFFSHKLNLYRASYTRSILISIPAILMFFPFFEKFST